MDPSRWMMLDRFVFHRDDEEEGSPFLDESKAPWRASSCTSLGKRFDILFLPAEPPAISRFYMRWADGTKSEGAKGTELVAAHRDLILFRQTSFGSSGQPIQDHFICIAYSTHLQLKLLPVCDKPQIFPSVRGEKTVSLPRVFPPHTVGLFRLGTDPTDEFAVVQLAMVNKIPGERKVDAEICVLRSNVYVNDGDGIWDVKTLPIEHQEDEYLELYYWTTDHVVTFNGYICWLNYYRGGMLIYDVLAEDPKIWYIRLPISDRPSSSAQGRAFYEMNRSVCLTRADIRKVSTKLKFTDIVRTDGELFGPLKEGSSFTIRSYTLSSFGSPWVEHDPIKSEQLRLLNDYPGLPHDIMMFPLVSLQDVNITYFLLSQFAEEKTSKVFLVTIDTSFKKVLAVEPYISEEEGSPSGPDADMIEEKSHLLKSFIPSRFPMFLTKEKGLGPYQGRRRSRVK